MRERKEPSPGSPTISHKSSLTLLSSLTFSSSTGSSNNLASASNWSDFSALGGYEIRRIADESDVRGFWSFSGRFIGPVMGFSSMQMFEKVFGKAPPDMIYHHNVMQFKDNIAKFGPWFIHNTRNIMLIPQHIHNRITILQNSILPYTNGLVYNQWVRQFDYYRQYQEGIKLYQQAVRDAAAF
jgi:hypothetical protein